MPKGVEHYWRPFQDAATAPVRIPLMPKGVEHLRCSRGKWNVCAVRIPLMPKGVEHHWINMAAAYRLVREDTSDAERR